MLDDALDSGMDSLYDEEDGDIHFEEAAEDREQDEESAPSLASIDIDKAPW